jgi:hypothetical protein
MKAQPLRSGGAEVIPLRPELDRGIHLSRHPSPFDRLTAELVLAQFRAGTLPEPVLLYLLAGVGLPA